MAQWHVTDPRPWPYSDVLLNGESVRMSCFYANEEARLVNCYRQVRWGEGYRTQVASGEPLRDTLMGKVELVRRQDG